MPHTHHATAHGAACSTAAGTQALPRRAQRRRLRWVLGLVLVTMVAEVVGGLLTGSLALLADAGHMLSDAGSLALALVAIALAERPRTAARTFGWQRSEVLAALVQGAALVAIAVLVVAEAWKRLQAPPAFDAVGMAAFAAVGLAVNLIGLAALHGGRHASLNLRGAWLHVATDTLGSVQALTAAGLAWAFGWHWADPVASLLIAALVAFSAWRLLREAVHVLLEGTPRHLDADQVRLALEAVPGVEDVHDLHLWTITSGFESLSVHARVLGRDRDEVLAELRRLLRERFGIHHSTVQLEGGPCGGGCCADEPVEIAREVGGAVAR